MNSRLKIKIVAFICALVTAALGFYYVQANNTSEQTYYVVKAKTNIAENTLITESMVALSEVKASDVTAGCVTSISSVVGKYAGTNIYNNEQIVSTRLVDQGSGTVSGFAYKIPEGMRTSTISIDSTSSVAGLLQVDDKVDVLATFTNDDGSKVTEYIANDIVIGALDKNIVKSEVNGNSTSSSGFTTVTLFTNPDLTLRITDIQNKGGTISLTLKYPEGGAQQ